MWESVAGLHCHNLGREGLVLGGKRLPILLPVSLAEAQSVLQAPPLSRARAFASMLISSRPHCLITNGRYTDQPLPSRMP